MPGIFRSILAALLVLLLAHPGLAQTSAPAPRSRTAEIRARVQALPIGGEVTVNMADGAQYCGNVQGIAPDTFSVREVDLHAVVTLRYDEVQRVRKGYGRPGFGGRRVYPRTNRIAGLAIAAGLIILVIAAVLSDKS